MEKTCKSLIKCPYHSLFARNYACEKIPLTLAPMRGRPKNVQETCSDMQLHAFATKNKLARQIIIIILLNCFHV